MLAEHQLNQEERMKPYTVYGRLITVDMTTFRQSSSPPSVIATNPIALQSILDCPTTVIRGDYYHPNPWTFSKTRYASFCGVKSLSTYYYSRTMTGVLGGPPVVFPSTSVATTEAYNKAVKQLGDKIRGSIDLSVTLGEGVTTVKMLNLVQRFRDGLTFMKKTFLRDLSRKVWTSYKRRTIKKYLNRWQRGIQLRYPSSFEPVPVTPGLISRVSRLGANGWLEFTYGWKPLCSDIYNVANQALNKVRGQLRKFKARGKFDLSSKDTPAPFEGAMCDRVTSGFAGVTIGVQMKQSFDPTWSLWTSLNPLTLLYELTPLSFVLDWVWDIGSYMRSLETALLYGLSVEKAYVSRLLTWTNTASCVNRKGNDGYTYTGRGYYHSTTFSRTISTTFPLPQIPKFYLDLGSARLLSAASLLRQLLK